MNEIHQEMLAEHASFSVILQAMEDGEDGTEDRYLRSLEAQHTLVSHLLYRFLDLGKSP